MRDGAAVHRGELGILFFGGYDDRYPRNALIRKGWKKCGFPAVECRSPGDLKVHMRYPSLLWKFIRTKRRGRLMFVPDFRHKDVPIAWALSRATGMRLIFDPLVSRYETRVLDRGDVVEGTMQSRHNRNIDRMSMTLPDLVLSDTDVHGDFYTEQFGLSHGRVKTLYGGADEDLFAPVPLERGSGRMNVLFYGSYLPLHGVETIIDASGMLPGEDVRFLLVGEGQTYNEMKGRAGLMSGANVEFRPEVPAEQLRGLIGSADIVLGVFGTTPKTAMVIPNKVYQALSVGRPVITADNAAIREVFQNGEHLMTVPAGDAAALAGAIETLRGDFGVRQRLANAGTQLVREEYSSIGVARRLAGIIEETGLL